MDESKRKTAIIMNAVVFPGIGHFMLGEKKKGMTIMALTLIFMFSGLLVYLTALNTQLESLNFAFSVQNQVTTALHLSWKTSYKLVLISLLGLLAVWFYSVFDICFRKNKSFKEDQSK